MKKSFQAVTVLILTLVLISCGGGGGGGSSSSSASTDTSGSSSVTTLQRVATTPGTGALAVNGNKLSVNYSLWLYDSSKASNEGKFIESGTYAFVLGAGAVIPGWDQGLVGVQAGGTYTLTIPSALAYGATGSGSIPPNAALVFTLTIISIS